MKDNKTINKRQWHELEQAAKTLRVRESVVLAAIEAMGNDREVVYMYIKSDTTQKTLAELPEPYRSQALANVNKGFENYTHDITDLDSALLSAFYWEKTPEGYDYWAKVYDAAYDLQYNYTPEKLLEKLNEGKEEEGE